MEGAGSAPLEALLASVRELAAAAAQTQEKCAELAESSNCFDELVRTLSTLDDVCRVQRACLPAHEVVTKDMLKVKKKRGPGRMAAASTAVVQTKPSAALEDFRDKLPRKYQTEEGMATMLAIRKMIRSEASGMSLKQVRERLGGKRSLMQCSQLLEVLCRLRYIVRETRSRRDGVRYFALRKKRKGAG